MFRNYPALRVFPLSSAAPLAVAPIPPAQPVDLDSPAITVMTDFTRTPAATIEQEALASFANEYMRRRNVRSLLVMDASNAVSGIVTTAEVLGEKPVRFALEYSIRREEVRVSDIMTPRALLEFLAFEDVRQARVGHIVASFRRAGRQHFLVRDENQGVERVRGIFSLSQIARQLGIPIELNTFASTFAEIEAALSH